MPILRWIREQIPNQFDIIKNYFNYGELLDNKGRHTRRDRLFFYGSRLVTRQIKRGDEDYVLAPVKVICIMNYEDEHPNSPDDRSSIIIVLRKSKPESLLVAKCRSFSELPRVMRYNDEYDSPIAGWCRILRNFTIFAKSRSEKDAVFNKLERAMRVSGLDDKEIDNYFSDMMTERNAPVHQGCRAARLPQRL